MTLENRTVERGEASVRLSLLGSFPRTREARYVKATGENTLLLITEGRCYDCKQRQQRQEVHRKDGGRKGKRGGLPIRQSVCRVASLTPGCPEHTRVMAA